MKKTTFIILLGLTLTLTACNNKAAVDTGAEVSATTSTESAVSEQATESAEETTAASAAESSQPDTTTASAPQDTTSKKVDTPTTTASQPPAQSQPATQAPATSTPAPTPQESQPPVTTSEPPPTPTEPLKPTYTEADYAEIISTIRTYGEAKGFVWNDSFSFGQAGLGYYGRPNLTTLSKAGVITDLKFNCDTIERDVGICYFKVVQYLYQGNVEFIVLYG